MCTYLEFNPPSATADFVVYMHHARFRVWRRTVEQFKTAQGMRNALQHVNEHVWAHRFAANEDAYSAVISEMRRID